uniref:Alpha/beta hydrolase fold-3 domain-containing protein n=1 Tax=Pyramimonas obovata TaxID=1411642 RepID=A0A7S0RPK9_9CHLO|mmetsp:Transcript_39156/g.85203  ORF Transcript_39156/g.85203 Transcript_39156/m.85203 type:complete len:200 (+) Transcript_39156:881-1480(+)|eukprot:CAMPEP_0118928822 /NCGR_PEP_ID=MMETSP1169-20130426/5981_1 /TAXON_ID=36882 /ORGANISM="Pyramimonas obovata, Strain CCMP722" /LENGTH=199 /DNA_ID=CAMNT_0006870885 /DNA_START=839 /DNA_END=1438 /DNA_ORIENTATION=+
MAVGVNFRNSGGKLRGTHPFPAGLNDCFTAAKWLHACRAQLHLDKIVLMGEGGGANLCLAVALRAIQEGRRELIDGVYAHCPYIYGKWKQDPAASAQLFPSLVENAGYVFDALAGVPIERLYCNDAEAPLAWPMSATEKDLAGMPPVTVQVNELDSLRDEGAAFCARLMNAGAAAELRTVAGQVISAAYVYGIRTVTAN